MGCMAKKVIQAGMGAAAIGAEKFNSSINRLAKEGEPLYCQARQAADKALQSIKKALQACCRDTDEAGDREPLMQRLSQMTMEELKALQNAVEQEMENREKEEARNPAPSSAPAEE